MLAVTLTVKLACLGCGVAPPTQEVGGAIVLGVMSLCDAVLVAMFVDFKLADVQSLKWATPYSRHD